MKGLNFFCGLSVLFFAFAFSINAQYCYVTRIPNCEVGATITNVTLGSINRNSVCDNYVNTGLSTSLAVGATNVQMKISSKKMNGSRIKVFIDFNRDNDFCDAGEVVYNYFENGENIDSTYSFYFDVPVDAVAGITGMRCMIDWVGYDFGGCGPKGCNGPEDYPGYGEVEDYKIDLYATATVPNCAVITYPADGATNIPIDTTLRWTSGGGIPTSYKLFLGTNNPPTNIVNGTNLGDVNFYTFSPLLQVNTTYYWKVVPNNSTGDATGCSTRSFKTALTNGIRGFVSGFTNLTISPNPFSNTLNLNFLSASDNITNIRIIDITGRTVLSKLFKSVRGNNNYSINAESLNNGIYFMQISYQSEPISYIKIIKN